jgi:HSP20 family protein
MALVRWEPARELASLQQEVNRLFGTFFDAPGATAAGPGAGTRRWIPAMDLVESDEAFVLKADLPGLAEEDVELEVEDGVLTVSGERAAEHATEREGFVRVEREFGAFRRSLTLPDGVDPEQVTARFDKGVLEVRIPKPENRKPRKVAIRVGDAPAAIEGRERREPAEAGAANGSPD